MVYPLEEWVYVLFSELALSPQSLTNVIGTYVGKKVIVTLKVLCAVCTHTP